VMGACPRRLRMGRGRAGDRQTGLQRAGGWLRVSPMWTERGGSPRDEARRNDGARCTCEVGAGCTAIHADTRSSGHRSPAGTSRDAEGRRAPRKRICPVHSTVQRINGPVHLAYNPSYSACFFSRNSIFLSQKISQQCFSAGL
jgi:hypothetical protein